MYLLKLFAWTYLLPMFLFGIFVYSLVEHVHGESDLNNIITIPNIQYITNTLSQSITIVLESKRPCLTEKEHLHKSLSSCIQDLEALHHSYTTQGMLLVEVKLQKIL